MSRFRPADILIELIELGRERTQELRQQLVYYRASVYKTETATLIAAKIEELRLLATLIGDEALCETFTDYHAMTKEGAFNCAPGECSVSRRVTLLVGALDTDLHRAATKLAARELPVDDEGLAECVRQYRHQLLALCRHGSRQWTFFQAL